MTPTLESSQLSPTGVRVPRPKNEDMRETALEMVSLAYDFSEGAWGLETSKLSMWLDAPYTSVVNHAKALEADGLIERMDGSRMWKPTAAGRAALAKILASRR